jgi:hypothetical protein
MSASSNLVHDVRGAATLRAAHGWSPVVAGLGVAGFALAKSSNCVPLADAAGVIRSLGLGRAGFFRAYELSAAQALQWVPLGTPAFRASLCAALMTGITAALTAAVFARWLNLDQAMRSMRREFIAFTATVGACLVPCFYADGLAIGGGAFGRMLLAAACWTRVCATATAGTSTSAARHAGRSALLGGLLGAACTHDLPTALLVALICFAGAPQIWGTFACAAALAALPIVAAAIRANVGDLSAYLEFAPSMMGDPAITRTPLRQVLVEIGPAVGAIACVGIWSHIRQRPTQLPVLAFAVALGASGAALVWTADCARVRPGTALGAVVFAAFGMAAVGFEQLLVLVENLRIPAAGASAGLLTVLGLAVPLRHIDALFGGGSPWAEQTDLLFADAAFGNLPTNATILTGDRGFARVHRALSAAGQVRADIQVLALFDLREQLLDLRHAAAGSTTFTTRPIIRDQMLRGAPTELGLSTVANTQPIAMVFNPKWDPALAKHLTTSGLVMTFASEPRGSSDRRTAHERFSPARLRLLRAVEPVEQAPLRAQVLRLLRARALAMAATGERESASLALDELRMFANDDPLIGELVRRVMLNRGGAHLDDLTVE